MPTYDYKCRDCGNTIEVIHSMLEDGPTTCERCGGPMRRILHPAGIIFKGSGFYKTDSRSAAAGSGTASSGSSGDSSAGSSPSSKSDAKTSGEDSKPSPAAASGD